MILLSSYNLQLIRFKTLAFDMHTGSNHIVLLRAFHSMKFLFFSLIHSALPSDKKYSSMKFFSDTFSEDSVYDAEFLFAFL